MMVKISLVFTGKSDIKILIKARELKMYMDAQVTKISEDDFAEKSKEYLMLPPQQQPKYHNRVAYVLPVSENELYVNVKGDCYIVTSYPVLDKLLNRLEGKNVDRLNDLLIPEIGPNEIKIRVNSFLNSLKISPAVINDRTIKLVDIKIAHKKNRIEILVDLYFLLGEYFCWAFKDKIIWENTFDNELEKLIPVIFYTEKKKPLFYGLKIHDLLNNDLVDIPLEYSVEYVFYLINKA